MTHKTAMICAVASVALSASVLIHLAISGGPGVFYKHAWPKEIQQASNRVGLRSLCEDLLWYAKNSYMDSGIFTGIVLIAGLVQMAFGIVLAQHLSRCRKDHDKTIK